jgi:hypothetical protein
MTTTAKIEVRILLTPLKASSQCADTVDGANHITAVKNEPRQVGLTSFAQFPQLATNARAT